jgi:hypothetical protein
VISGCTNLEFLDLHSNALSGSQPDMLPRSLQLVDVSGNQLAELQHRVDAGADQDVPREETAEQRYTAGAGLLREAPAVRPQRQRILRSHPSQARRASVARDFAEPHRRVPTSSTRTTLAATVIPSCRHHITAAIPFTLLPTR